MGGVGPKDIGSLVSTVERQFSSFGGVNLVESDFEAIASLLYGLIKNHSFYDGNKRTAFLCCLLQLNKMNRTISVTEKVFEDLMWKLQKIKLKRNQGIGSSRRRRCRNLRSSIWRIFCRKTLENK